MQNISDTLHVEAVRFGLYVAHIETRLNDEGQPRKYVYDVVDFLEGCSAGTCTDWSKFQPLDVDFCASETAEAIVEECAAQGWLMAGRYGRAHRAGA